MSLIIGNTSDPARLADFKGFKVFKGVAAAATSNSNQYTILAASGDPAAGPNSLIVVNSMINCRFKFNYNVTAGASGGSAPGVTKFEVNYEKDGASLTWSDGEAFTFGCPGGMSTIKGAAEIVANRDDGSSWGKTRVEFTHGGSNVTPCPGNFGSAKFLILIPENLTVQQINPQAWGSVEQIK